MEFIKSDEAKEKAMKRIWIATSTLALVLAVAGASLEAQTQPGQVYTDENSFFAALSLSATVDFDNGASTDLPGTVSSGVTGVSDAAFFASNATSTEATSPGGGVAGGVMTGENGVQTSAYIEFISQVPGEPNAIAFQALNLFESITPEERIRVTVMCSDEDPCGVFDIGGPGQGDSPIFFGLINDSDTFLGLTIEGLIIAQTGLCPAPPCPSGWLIDDFTWGTGSTGQQGGPDLVVDSLTHEPANPTTDDNIEFTAVVKNIGDATAGASILSFKIGGESPSAPEALFSVPALTPGATATFERVLDLVAQNYQNTAVADFNQAVAESNENNNTTLDFFTVTEPDEPPVTTAALAFNILSLPANGKLFSSQGVEITAAPFALADPNVMYEPNEGFAGVDEFEYQIDKGGLLSNIGKGYITVAGLTCATCVNVSVDFQGAGMGSVKPSPDPQGLVTFCQDDCVLQFPPGSTIKLQARANDGGNTFVQWGGACASAGSDLVADLVLPASGGTSCTATFGLMP